MKIMLFYFLFTYFYLWLLPSYSPIMFYDEKYDRKCDRFISMMILINYAEYYVEIYVLPYTVMFGGVLKRWEEPFLAVTLSGKHSQFGM